MEKLLTAKELSDALGVKLSTVYSWSHKKLIPRASNMRLLRFRENDVLAWLKEPEKTPEKTAGYPKAKKRHACKGNNQNIDALVAMAKKAVLK
jgi:excisionase family DNA binding protein